MAGALSAETPVAEDRGEITAVEDAVARQVGQRR
jgi:hypothetical protein